MKIFTAYVAGTNPFPSFKGYFAAMYKNLSYDFFSRSNASESKLIPSSDSSKANKSRVGTFLIALDMNCSHKSNHFPSIIISPSVNENGFS